MVTRTQAIRNFLNICGSPSDLVSLYNEDMECQVAVKKLNNKAIKNQEYKGRKFSAYVDIEDGTVYKAFRIPWDSMKESVNYTDSEMTFDLGKYADGVGLTGWDWKNKRSRWVGFDFDSLMNHKKGLSPEELEKIKKSVWDLDYVTIRSSTTGSGFHIYVFVDSDLEVKTHTEHQCLARAILNKMTLDCGYELQSKVDQLGAILWIWASKMDPDKGFKLIKQGNPLTEIPLNWKDHISVVTKRINKIRPNLIKDEELDDFNELAKKRMAYELDDKHRKIIEELGKLEYETSWNSDYGMLITHTIALKEVHKKLTLVGPFETASTGSSAKNCYAFPISNGGWSVRRHGRGVVECNTWLQDSGGWTHCYFNTPPDFETACKTNKGIEDTDQSYVFKGLESAKEAAKQLGIDLDLKDTFQHRQIKLKMHSKTNKLVVEMNAENGDPNIDGWIKKRNIHQFVSNVSIQSKIEKNIESNEDEIRHCVNEENCSAGWYIRGFDGAWIETPRINVLSVLSSMGYTHKEREMAIGRITTNYWILTNEPFQEEYPGNRRWNKDPVQLRYKCKSDEETLSYPHWNMILDHLGQSLDDSVAGNKWCRENDITNGASYLKCWIASMIQFPKEPLPYLFFYGKENSGKTTLHEAIELLITKQGVKRVSTALQSTSDFNKEVLGVVLGVIEEVNMSSKRSGPVIQKIKDWVTSKNISIHPKGETPYMTRNTLHFIQCSNDMDAAPVFPGDTRMVVIHVGPLKSEIPQSQFFPMLEKEAQDFTTELVNLEIPPAMSRFRIPVIETEEKKTLADSNKSDVDRFIDNEVFDCDGEVVSCQDLWDAFCEFTDPGGLTLVSFNRLFQVTKGTVKGKYGPANRTHWANVTLNYQARPTDPFIKVGEQLKRQENYAQ